ncbi:F0F1 ATP synthase subunit delta, partial [Candidatus Omnitrophota bacterium]
SQQQAREIVERANLQSEKKNAQLLERMQARAVEVGQQAVAYVLGSPSRRILQEVLTQELITEMKDIKLPDNIRLEKGGLRVEAVSAYPLSDGHKQEIEQVIQKRLGGQELEFSFKVDEGIIAGLVLNFSGRVVDGSLSNRLRQAVVLIQEKK